MRYSVGLVVTLLILTPAACTSVAPDPRTAAAPQVVQPPSPNIGDRWLYNQRNGYNGVIIGVWRREIETASPGRTMVSITKVDGQPSKNFKEAYDPLWNLVQEISADGRQLNYSPTATYFAFPLKVGRSWRSQFFVTDTATGKRTRRQIIGKVTGWEMVRVPAGEFLAMKIVRDVYLGDHDWWRSQTLRTEVDWYAPQAKWIVKHEDYEEFRDLTKSRESSLFDESLVRGDRNIWELVSFDTKKR